MNRNPNRYSVIALFSMVAEQDVEVEIWPEVPHKRLRDLNGKISTQSKKNFVLERDVFYLDSQIPLLIQNKMALSEVKRTHEEVDLTEGRYPDSNNRKLYQLQPLLSKPCHIAALCQLISISTPVRAADAFAKFDIGILSFPFTTVTSYQPGATFGDRSRGKERSMEVLLKSVVGTWGRRRAGIFRDAALTPIDGAEVLD
ncbi:hypothetical protein K435DRAFT_861414 [Dendrothele bispora CBS 962.96]|uniref:Uncharacterized protein n=1 Tax=Dendrothele bispora (strain CBS 962.96) TaxID=1314807 RepID=A0A4S8LVG4_DENBC|nr:hypothetical protein K435DRAFT_861414 [Dendrothele bispora CBS 962.96]